MGRSRVRAFEAAGIRVSVEAPPALPWALPAELAPFACGPESASLQVGVRVAEPEDPTEGGALAALGGFEARFDAGGAVLVERRRGRVQRLLRMDAELRLGELVVAPDAPSVRRGSAPLAGLDEIVFRHRSAREGRVPLDLCVVECGGRAIGFASASQELGGALARVLASGSVSARAGLFVLAASEDGARLHTTPWVRDAPAPPTASLRGEASGPTGPGSRSLAELLVVGPAPELVAEPVCGARALAAVEACSVLFAGDRVGVGRQREALETLLRGLRVVRLRAPRDARLARYVFGPTGLPGQAAPTALPPPAAP